MYSADHCQSSVILTKQSSNYYHNSVFFVVTFWHKIFCEDRDTIYTQIFFFTMKLLGQK